MIRIERGLIAFAGAIVLGSMSACSNREPVDLVLTGAAIYTLDPAHPWAEAMAVRAGRIVAIGSDEEIREHYSAHAHDLDGAMVLPGFHDAHVHPIGAGIDLSRCDLSEAETVEAIVVMVEVCHARESATSWLLGFGWSLGLFPAGNPNKALLDAVSASRPILLQGADGHSSWANSAALHAAGIDAATPDPPLGVIERDASGEPSGTLRESAQDLLWSLVPEPGIAEREAALARAVGILNSFGITSFIEANASIDDLSVYGRLDTAGELAARVVVSLSDRALDGDLGPALEPAGASESRVRAGAVKIFLDGVLEGETAALLEPYLDARGGHRGRLTMSPEALTRRITELDAAGLQVHVHAIGDWAVRTALDAFAAARRTNGAQDNRHHIAHLQLVDPSDYPRFAALDVTANFQAVWAFPDDYIVNINLPQVGPERVERMYPIGSLVRAGARIVGGSDWNVTTPNPLVAIEVALTRRDPSGRRSAVLNAAQAVDLDTMLRAYTVNGAWLMRQEASVGMLAPGMRADFVVLAENLFEIPADAIGEVPILATYLEGIPVFEAVSR